MLYLHVRENQPLPENKMTDQNRRRRIAVEQIAAEVAKEAPSAQQRENAEWCAAEIARIDAEAARADAAHAEQIAAEIAS